MNAGRDWPDASDDREFAADRDLEAADDQGLEDQGLEDQGLAAPMIRRLARFEILTEADRAALARLCGDTFSTAQRTEIAREGERPDAVFVLLEGMACRYKTRDDGIRQILAYMVPGDSCDIDMALLARRDHAIGSLSTCRFARIGFETLLEMTLARDPLVHALRRASLADDATLREWLVNLGSRPAIERIAHLFLELLARFQAVGLARGNTYRLPLSQLDLADTTGLSTVHVNRTLQTLKRQGLVELRSRILTIHDPRKLAALSGFDPGYLTAPR